MISLGIIAARVIKKIMMHRNVAIILGQEVKGQGRRAHPAGGVDCTVSA